MPPKQPPLIQAILRQNSKKVARILQRRYRPHYSPASLVDQTTWSGVPALHYAMARDETAIPRMLLQCGASPNVRNEQLSTALHLAYSEEMLTLLMEHGADPYLHNQFDRMPLHTYVCQQRVQAMRALLRDWSFPADATCAGSCSTALHLARTPLCANLLMDYGANASALNANGNTPLDEAFVVTSVPLDMHVIQALYARGGYWNRSPLLVSWYRYRLPSVLPRHIITWLINCGADVMERNCEGQNVLHNVVGKCDVRTIALLLRAGADPNALDSKGRSPLHPHYTTPRWGVRTAALPLLVAAGGLLVDQAQAPTHAQWRAAREMLGVCKIP